MASEGGHHARCVVPVALVAPSDATPRGGPRDHPRPLVRQPGDGSCLFHSMAYGLKDGSNAGSLRKGACDFMARNANSEIMETIQYDSHCGWQSM